MKMNEEALQSFSKIKNELTYTETQNDVPTCRNCFRTFSTDQQYFVHLLLEDECKSETQVKKEEAKPEKGINLSEIFDNVDDEDDCICSLCNSQFENLDALSKHSKDHNELRYLTSNVCVEDDTFYVYKNDTSKFSKNFLFTCKFCNREYQRYPYKEHMIMHLQESRLTLNRIKMWQFETPILIGKTKSISLILGKSPKGEAFLCALNDEGTSSFWGINQAWESLYSLVSIPKSNIRYPRRFSISENHCEYGNNCFVQNDYGKIKCKVCGLEIKDNGRYYHHLLKHSIEFGVSTKASENVFKCLKCYESYSSPNEFSKHILLHDEVKNMVSTAMVLDDSHHIHESEKKIPYDQPLDCKFCNQQVRKKDFTMHIEMHLANEFDTSNRKLIIVGKASDKRITLIGKSPLEETFMLSVSKTYSLFYALDRDGKPLARKSDTSMINMPPPPPPNEQRVIEDFCNTPNEVINYENSYIGSVAISYEPVKTYDNFAKPEMFENSNEITIDYESNHGGSFGHSSNQNADFGAGSFVPQNTFNSIVKTEFQSDTTNSYQPDSTSDLQPVDATDFHSGSNNFLPDGANGFQTQSTNNFQPVYPFDIINSY